MDNNYLPTKKENIKYSPNVSTQDTMNLIKAIAIPTALFALALFVISSFANFGSFLIAPMTGGCWMVGFIVALIMPAQRKSTIRETEVFIGGYLLGLYAIKIVIGLASGVSAEMIAASFDQAIPTATGNAIPGYLQTMLLITAFMGPIGFVGMQGKRLLTFRRNQSMQKVFQRTQGIRNAGKNQ